MNKTKFKPNNKHEYKNKKYIWSDIGSKPKHKLYNEIKFRKKVHRTPNFLRHHSEDFIPSIIMMELTKMKNLRHS